MKKNIFILSFLLCFLLKNVAIFAVEQSNSITAYALDKQEFLTFINHPSSACLKDTAIQQTFLGEEKIIDGKTYFSACEKLDGEVTWTGNIFAIDKQPLYVTFFKLCNNYDTIEKLFAEQGIVCVIKGIYPFFLSDEYVAKEDFSVPLTLFIESDDGYYFVSVNEFETLQNQTYSLHIYTQNQYAEKFGLQNGTFIINGIAETNNYLKFQNTGCYVPLRAIMEHLGCTVYWDAVTKNIHIENGQSEVIICPDRYNNTVFEILNDASDYYLCYELINDNTIIYEKELRAIIHALKLQISVELDYENRILYINN